MRQIRLTLAAHDVDEGGGGVYNLRELSHALAGLGDDLGADYVLNEIAALGQLCVGPVYEDAPALEPHGGVHVLHALERGEDGALVHAGGAHPDRFAVYIQCAERGQELRGIRPGEDLYLAPDAVGVHYLARFDKSLFHTGTTFSKSKLREAQKRLP